MNSLRTDWHFSWAPKYVTTLSSSVNFSFFSFSLSTAFSSQRLALAFRSLAPPEMTPDFWKRVPSRATVWRRRGDVRGAAQKHGKAARRGELKHLVPVGAAEGDAARVLHVIADQGVAARVLQGLLDLGRLVANHVDHQLGSSQLSQFLVRWFYLLMCWLV